MIVTERQVVERILFSYPKRLAGTPIDGCYYN